MARAAAKTGKARKAKAAVSFEPLPDDAVLLTLDASSTAIGYAVFIAGRLAVAGLVPAAPKGWASHRRIVHNANAMMDVIGGLEMEKGLVVSHAAMEWNSHMVSGGNRMATGLATLGQAQGYLLALLHERWPGVEVDLISERQWTKWSDSHLNVKKEKRAERIMVECPEYRDAVAKDARADVGWDVCDAIGIGLFRLGRIK